MMLLLYLVLALCASTQAAPSRNATGTALAQNATATQTIRKIASKHAPSSVIEGIHAHRASLLAKPKSSPTPVPAAASFAPNTPDKHSNVSYSEVQSARKLVAAAHASQAAYNTYRNDNPRRNTNLPRNSAGAQAAKEKRDEGAVVEPVHSEAVLDAVKLLGNIDAIARDQNGTLVQKYAPHNYTSDHFPRTGGKLSKRDNDNDISKRTLQDSFWIPNLHDDTETEPLGSSPFGGDSSYQVYRSVRDYGAYGDGTTDDTDAINLAISDGNRCGINCLSSSVKPAIVYFPLGTYRITKPIIMLYNTQLVGYIPTEGTVPSLIADPNFMGQGVITSDIYLPDGVSEWYIEQSNFYRQIRNFDIDLSAATLEGICGVHWQVAQATSISNVNFIMTPKDSSTQIGIFAENGSGGWMSDLTFSGGQYGILGGNQQYTVRGLWFYSSANAIGMIWDWGWTWSQLHVIGCDVGINMVVPGSSIGDPVGSMYLMDSDFVTTPVVIYTYPWVATEQANTVITLDNIQMIGVGAVFSFTNGYVSTIDTSVDINFLTVGDIEADGSFYGPYELSIPARPAVLTSDEVGFTFAQTGWMTRSKPSYYQESYDIFFNAKWYAAGDGETDDTAWIQAMLDYCAAQDNCILFFPAGTYVITSTIVIPINSFIVGEAWSQIMAVGDLFADASNPTAAVLVANDDDAPGDIEIQDMLFTSRGNLPGLVMVVWQAQAATQGSVALWDTHFRVGGALGTDLQVAQCPIHTGGINYACSAAFAMMIIQGDGYFENMWAWGADHDIDDPVNTQVDVYSGRGILITGDGPVWLWGTASEHSTLYQYAVIEASNVFMSMIQTESPYQQGSVTTQAPAPFDQVVSYLGDPSFTSCGSATTSCNNAWAVNIQNSQNIYINGAGLYSWFQNYDEDCVKTANCQQKMIYIYNTASLYLNHVITIGAVEMITPDATNEYNEIVLATDNLQATEYPWWSVVATYLDSSDPIDITADPIRVRHGWVAFGDSYAAGIGAGDAADSSDPKNCKRGKGGYPWQLEILLNLAATPPGSLQFQPLPCSGDIANDITKTGGQLDSWTPATSDMATLSIIGNDFQFSNIVKFCIIGYRGGSDPTCDKILTTAEDLLTNNQLLVNLTTTWTKILAKSTQPHFTIYQTGYPQFFQNSDTTCNNDYFGILYLYYGEYLTQALRGRMNQLSVNVNALIGNAIDRWNSDKPREQIVFVQPDNTVYPAHRYCENNIDEPQSGTAQNNVAFFYVAGSDYSGPDVVVTDDSSWPETTVNSATCTALGSDDWVIQALCQATIAATTNAAVLTSNSADGDGTWTKNSDGSVSVTTAPIRWEKFFHPKTWYNQQIGYLLWKTITGGQLP